MCTVRRCPPCLQNKALRERLHASQAAADENAKLKADVQQLCQQMVRWEARQPSPQPLPHTSISVIVIILSA